MITIFCLALLFNGANEILHQSDQSRLNAQYMKVELSLEVYENDKLQESERLDVYNQGSDKALVKFLDKKRNGQLVLSVADNMWIYFPNTRKPLRITPMQRLMGQASNGDIARLSYSADYDATLLREDVYDGQPCWVLELTAKSRASTYRKVHYWVTKNDALPLKADFFLISGKYFKRAFFEDYKKVDGRWQIGAIRYQTIGNEKETTVMRFIQFSEKELPGKFFNKNYLSKVKF